MTQHHIPQHIGIIMDGNNRWAKLRGKRKLAGHAAGADSLRSVTRKCLERGVHSLSIFAFSSENWNRPNLKSTVSCVCLREHSSMNSLN